MTDDTRFTRSKEALCNKGSHFLIMPLSTEVLLDHIVDYLLFPSDIALFWFTLNTSYDHPPLSSLIILSLRCPLIVSSHWLVVALPLIVPPSCPPLTLPLFCHLAPAGCCINSCHPPSRPLIVPPPCPLVVLSLGCPLLISSRRLVVALPLVAPPSHCPLTALPSCHLALAGCCVASHRTTLMSSCCAILLFSSCAPAGCCMASIKQCRCHHQTHPPSLPPPPPLLP
jgi:hypothetical protein